MFVLQAIYLGLREANRPLSALKCGYGHRVQKEPSCGGEVYFLYKMNKVKIWLIKETAVGPSLYVALLKNAALLSP